MFVYFERRDVDRTDQLTDRVNVDYAADGIPIGVEFLDVSLGIDLDNVPHRADVSAPPQSARWSRAVIVLACLQAKTRKWRQRVV